MNIVEVLFQKDHTSLCLQLIFQSNEKTLENKEIENIINNLQTVLSKNLMLYSKLNYVILL
jgi:phenylalanyl-tRNA synthetase beta subunit